MAFELDLGDLREIKLLLEPLDEIEILDDEGFLDTIAFSDMAPTVDDILQDNLELFRLFGDEGFSEPKRLTWSDVVN